MLGYSETSKTVKGVYAAIGRLRRLEPDRRGDGQLAQEASREAPMENEPEPALVLARLRAMRAGTTPSLDVLYSAIFRGVLFRPCN